MDFGAATRIFKRGRAGAANFAAILPQLPLLRLSVR
jgi:hypothetical protein